MEQLNDARRRLGDALVPLLPRLRRFARGLAGSVADGDDVVQLACERALQRADQWQPGTRLDSWMFRIAQTVWFNEVGRRRRQNHLALATQDGEPVGDAAAELEARATLRRVRDAVGALSEEQRAVVMLVCVEGMSYREAAESLGVPIGTVMSRLGRGRLALNRLLEGPGASLAAATMGGAGE